MGKTYRLFIISCSENTRNIVFGNIDRIGEDPYILAEVPTTKNKVFIEIMNDFINHHQALIGT